MEIHTDTTADINTASMLKLIKLPDLLSILNALLGFAAILLVLGGNSVTGAALKTALILILLAAVVDGLDGMVARNLESSPLGEYLDSLADIVSFGIAPAIIVYVLITGYFGFSSTYIGVVLAVCGAYVTSGVLRLARFNANLPAALKSVPKQQQEQSNVTNEFEGFPIPGSATFLAAFMLLAIELQPQFPRSASAPILIGLMGILCVLMCSRIRYRKLGGKRISVPVGIVLFALFIAYITSSGIVYPAIAVVILVAVYMCSPLLRLFTLSKAINPHL